MEVACASEPHASILVPDSDSAANNAVLPAEDAPQPQVFSQLKAQQRVALGHLLFTSDFECGNMGRVERLERPQLAAPLAAPGKDKGAAAIPQSSGGGHSHEEYVVTIAPDCAGTPCENSQRTWFYFGVSLLAPLNAASDGHTELLQEGVFQDDAVGVAKGGAGDGLTIDLVVRNMNNQSKLFREGYKPWWRRTPSSPHWCRLSDSSETAFSFEWGGEPAEGGTGLSIRWRFRLDNDGSTTYFAFCAPFGHQDCQRLLDTLEEKLLEYSLAPQKHSWPLRCISDELQEEWVPKVGKDIYFHRQQLALSREGRAIELLTISSSVRQPWDAAEGHTAAAAAELDLKTGDLGHTSQDTLPSELPAVAGNAPHRFVGRPLVFFSARVHPGETPGQFAFLGLLRFLLSADPRAKELRERFVFKLVPMLNPDGVARGHHRTNSVGLDLNRCYTNPTFEEHEGVWLTKRILLHWAAQKRLFFCVDFHGHPSRRGCFLLGNKNSGVRQTWNIAFARLCQLNSPHFEVDSCDFEDKAADGDGDDSGLCLPGKHGTARAAIHRDCQICHVYTFEANFHSGRSTKPMAAVLGPGEECPGAMVKSAAPMPYGHSSWAQAGEAIGVSLLDAYGHNCYSRLPSSRYCSLGRLLSLSPSFNSHRGQYGPPDDMPKILGPAYTSVFELQQPCRCSSCCWHTKGSRLACSASGHAVGATSCPNAWSGLSHTSPLQSSVDRVLNFSDVAPSSPVRPSLPSALELNGGKASWALPQKPSAPGKGRPRRSLGAAPASPSKTRTNPCAQTARPPSPSQACDRTPNCCQNGVAPSSPLKARTNMCDGTTNACQKGTARASPSKARAHGHDGTTKVRSEMPPASPSKPRTSSCDGATKTPVALPPASPTRSRTRSFDGAMKVPAAQLPASPLNPHRNSFDNMKANAALPPPSASRPQRKSLDGPTKANSWSRGMAIASKAGGDERLSRSPSQRQHTTGTASAGALIVGCGMRHNLSSPVG